MTETHDVEMTLTDEKLREIVEAGGVIDRWEVGEATVEGSKFTVPIKLWFTYPERIEYRFVLGPAETSDLQALLDISKKEAKRLLEEP